MQFIVLLAWFQTFLVTCSLLVHKTPLCETKSLANNVQGRIAVARRMVRTQDIVLVRESHEGTRNGSASRIGRWRTALRDMYLGSTVVDVDVADVAVAVDVAAMMMSLQHR